MKCLTSTNRCLLKHSRVQIEVGAEPYIQEREFACWDKTRVISLSFISVLHLEIYFKGAGLGIMSASCLELCQLLCELDTSLPLPRCGEQKNIDTHPFREAIWYYIHGIKGIRHDDYHYRKVPALLHHLIEIWLDYCIRSATSLNFWARMCCKVVSGCDPPVHYISVLEVHCALDNVIEMHSGTVHLSDCQHSLLVVFCLSC